MPKTLDNIKALEELLDKANNRRLRVKTQEEMVEVLIEQCKLTRELKELYEAIWLK